MAHEDTLQFMTLKNQHGTTVRLCNYGASIVSISVPDKDGKFEDILAGYGHDSLYKKNSRYFGSIAGQFANRVHKGQFKLDGKLIQLDTNANGNHLHGGKKGFNYLPWYATPVQTDTSSGVVFELQSPENDGYPGTLGVKSTIWLTENDQLIIEYKATTDKKTILNLTHHPYFNLNPGGETILGHEMKILASHFLPVSGKLIPTGEIRNVANTPFDFTSFKSIGKNIEEDNMQLKHGNQGYDHCFVLDKGSESLALACSVFDPVSGRSIELYTTEPAMQFYSGNFFQGDFSGKNGKKYPKYASFVLEPQHFPDSPNHGHFPDVILEPGEKFYSKTVYQFSVK